MPEKGHVYETNVVTMLKLKTPSVDMPSPMPEKKWRRAVQKPQKSTPEMIAIVLRLIEYFENSEPTLRRHESHLYRDLG
jgi:hypothetical protein